MQEGTADLTTTLARMALFQGLDRTLVNEVACASQVVKRLKGGRFYEAGDIPRGFYHVLSGQVKVAVASAEGGEKVIDIVSPGRSCGLAEVFGCAPYASFAEAVQPALLVCIGKEAILRALPREPRLAQRLLGAMAERQSAIERDVAASSFQSGPDRVVDYLLRTAGPNLNRSGNTLLELTVPKHLIAARLGVTPETLSRAFRELSDAGLISVRGKRVTLLEKLVARQTDETGDPGEGLPPDTRSLQRLPPWPDRSAPLRPPAAWA